MLKRGIQSFTLLFFVVLGFKPILSDNASFRMTVTRNDQEVGGELHADLELRITSGLDTNTLHSMTADIYYGSGLTEWDSDPVVEWGVWDTDSSYFRTVSKLSACYRVMITQGDTLGVNWREDGSPPGDPVGWDARMVWKKIVTLKWEIASLGSFSLSINDDTDAAAYFENVQNIPYATTLANNWNVSNGDISNPLLVKTKIFLEGPYISSGDSMRTLIRKFNLIAEDSPYSSDLRNTTSIPDSVVDWIHVQLRSSAFGSAVASRSCFLSKEGYLIETNGRKGISMDLSNNSYYIVIKQRNHLAVMSRNPVNLSNITSSLYDFTLDSTQYFWHGGTKEIESSVWGMIAGDVNQDKNVTVSDDNIIMNNRNQWGYEDGDVNLDINVSVADDNMCLNNRNASAGVP